MSDVDLSEAGLDELAAEFNKANGAPEEVEAPEVVEEVVEAEVVDDAPGYMDYEAWIADGRDPDDFKGKNAYKAEHERIVERREAEKEMKEELRGMKETLGLVVESAEEVRRKDREENARILEEKLAQAKRDMDVDGALEAQQELDDLQKKEPPPLNPIIPKFFGENPLLDESSGQYNADFYTDFASVYTSKMDALTSYGSRPVTDNQVKKALNASLSEAKTLNPELFKSQRSGRQAPQRTSQAVKTSKVLSDYKIDDATDPRNQNAADEIYEMIKKQSPEKAEEFKKSLLGEQ